MKIHLTEAAALRTRIEFATKSRRIQKLARPIMSDARLRVLCCLRAAGETVTAHEIAERCGIKIRVLRNLLTQMNYCQLVKRHGNGGYYGFRYELGEGVSVKIFNQLYSLLLRES